METSIRLKFLEEQKRFFLFVGVLSIIFNLLTDTRTSFQPLILVVVMPLVFFSAPFWFLNAIFIEADDFGIVRHGFWGDQTLRWSEIEAVNGSRQEDERLTEIVLLGEKKRALLRIGGAFGTATQRQQFLELAQSKIAHENR